MWIRLQKKMALVKTNNFYIEKTRNESCLIKADVTEGVYTLGEYSTEEKAIKVLDMIQNRILSKDYYTTGIGYPIIKDKVFQMPRDSEV